MSLEVSNITQTISSSNSQCGLSALAYQIGTRSASTSLRLKDGETQILGGLIQDEERDAANKIPGLGQLPVLGRLFSNHNGDHKKTEIVLQITPHIIRPQLAADGDTREVWSGTDTNVRTEQLRLDPPSTTGSGTPVALAPVAAATAVAVVPGAVGGGTSAAEQKAAAGAPAGAAASTAAAAGAVPAKGAFGQPPPAPRTTPPTAMFGGRFMTSVPPPASATVPQAAPAAGTAATDVAAGTAGTAPAADATAGAGAVVTPVQQPVPSSAPVPVTPAPSPPPIMPTPPSDMPTDNPLHAIPAESH
jgi:general secretion pathway protein D